MQESFATVACEPPIWMTLLINEETALATITITDIIPEQHNLTKSDLQYGKSEYLYEIDKIQYLPTAKSEIQITNGSFYDTSLLEIGEQYVLGLYKNNNHWEPTTGCSSVSNLNVLEFVKWIEPKKQQQIESNSEDMESINKYLYDVSWFNLWKPLQGSRDPIVDLNENTRIFIGQLKEIETYEKKYDRDFVQLYDTLTFDIAYEFLKSKDKSVKFQNNHWHPLINGFELEKGQHYFLITNHAHPPSHETKILIPVEKAYEFIKSFYSYDFPIAEEFLIEPESKELKIPASFVDKNKDPQHYIDRYNNEKKYQEWFDKNYSLYSSIYHAVGLDEPDKNN